MQSTIHVYEVRPRKDKRGVDLLSDVLPFGRFWYTKIIDAVGYAEHFRRSQDAVIRVYNDAGNVIETHEHAGLFQGVVTFSSQLPGQHVQCRMAYAWPFFTSSSS
jgi:hypothetical protein